MSSSCCRSGWTYQYGYCYSTNGGGTATWDAAKNACAGVVDSANQQAYLASVLSDAENTVR